MHRAPAQVSALSVIGVLAQKGGFIYQPLTNLRIMCCGNTSPPHRAYNMFESSF